MKDKDYSLLRPFDAEKAKAGEAICTDVGTVWKYIDGPDHFGTIAVRLQDDTIGCSTAEYIRMAPLAWVDRKPVYVDDCLYSNGLRCCVLGAGAENQDQLILTENGSYRTSELSWQPPKPKTFTLAGIEVPMPESEAPQLGALCWTANTFGVCEFQWSGAPTDFQRLAEGVVHLTAAHAETHSRALLKANQEAISAKQKQHVRWINAHSTKGSVLLHETKEDADGSAARGRASRIACIKVEFDEGDGL